MNAVSVFTAALLGLVVGSFINVVIVRVPRGESIVRPRSRCVSCSAQLRARDNIPVVSFLLLRGRCRSCGARISCRYLLVELTMAALFMLALARLGISPALPAFLVAIAGLVALGSIDLELYILPVRVLYPTLVATAGLLVLAAFVGHEWSRLLSAAIGGLLLTGMFFVIHRCAPPMLGFGDVRLAALVGGCLGWFGVGATEIGFLAGNALALAVAIIRIRRGSATRRTPIPYGTFLSLGAIIGMFAGPPLSSLVIR